MIVTRHYERQHYSVIFDTRSGFFARVEDTGWSEPSWAEHGPELMDIGITNWCDRGCESCYRRSHENGVQMQMSNYGTLIRQASDMGVLQVALGGGNPNQHPCFAEILASTRDEYGIVPSYTTNGRGLTPEVMSATRRYCGAVAVSVNAPYREAAEAVRKLVAHGIKTNLHFILDYRGVGRAISWLEDPPKWFHGLNAIIFLNFKPVTRNGKKRRLAKSNPRVGQFFHLATTNAYPFKVGFDSCCTAGVLTYGDAVLTSVEACDAARFSMFVSEEMRAYPCSFMAELCEGHEVTSTNLQQIWQGGDLFVQMRESLSPRRCGKCSASLHCMSGCPLFPEINICKSVIEETNLISDMDGDGVNAPGAQR
jgi:radical SAM protein with 4Fe4S-binding SPASM domain